LFKAYLAGGSLIYAKYVGGVIFPDLCYNIRAFQEENAIRTSARLKGTNMRPIDAKTTVCALFGHPVGHSLSPAIHNRAFESLGLPYVYVAHDIQPGEVGKALAGVRAMGYRGLSVTIPHKVEAMENVDQVDETARRIGCINTVVNEDGRLLGYNSDGLGALGALRDAGAEPEDRRVLVLGSGGAARAIAVTLACEAPPSRISILGVVKDELARLTRDVADRGTSAVEGRELTDQVLQQELKRADILMHCSPVGMHPKVDASLVPAHLLREDLVVFDAVYNPRRTKLLRETEAAGGKAIEGLEMFLGQAYVQFERWTGKPAPRGVMRKVVEESL
jgi:shikimate dehydrogenase